MMPCIDVERWLSSSHTVLSSETATQHSKMVTQLSMLVQGMHSRYFRPALAYLGPWYIEMPDKWGLYFSVHGLQNSIAD